VKPIARISEFAFSMLGFFLKDSCRIFQKLPFGEALGVGDVGSCRPRAGARRVCQDGLCRSERLLNATSWLAHD
jgi:hypothetical protein